MAKRDRQIAITLRTIARIPVFLDIFLFLSFHAESLQFTGIVLRFPMYLFSD
jgi:hypothetical protein